jgi:selenocysteine lyase/cysteine desulfurase
MPYHAFVRESLAACVGALPSEVVAMNTLTVNLHLLMVSFYRPTAERPAILIEAGAFPSDRYAVESQIRFHGFDPATDLIEVEGDEPNGTISMALLENILATQGHRIALVLWPGVQYRTGQAFDLREIAKLAHAQGAIVGYDLAHGAGKSSPATARQQCRLRRVVQLQVPELRPGRGRRLLRARAPRDAPTARASPAGGGTTRPRASGWARVPADARAPTAGS